LVWVPALVVTALAALPLLYLVLRAAEAGAGVWSLLLRPRTAQIAFNTALLAGSVAVSTTVIAVPLAWLTARTDLPGRRFWATAAILPLVIPSYVGALAIVAALGPKGMVQGWLEPLGVERLPSIYGFWGSWLALTLFTYPYVLLVVRASLRGLDPALEEAARCLGRGAWRTFLFCTLPQLRPAIAAGALLAALYTVGEFGVVAMLRYDAFTRAVYTQYRSALDRSGAALMALLLVLFAVLVLLVEARVRGRATLHRVGSGAARAPRLVPLGRWRWPAVGFCVAVVGLALGLPLAVLGYWFGRAAADGLALDGLATAARHSLGVGSGAALVAALAALPVAILSVRYRGRLGVLAERTSFLGYALPGIAVALAFVAFGVRTPFHQTLPLLILAYVVRFLPEAIGAMRVSLLQVNPRLEEAARGLGSSQAGAIRRVTVPLVRPGVLAGAALVMLTTLKELPVTLLLSPTGFTTLPTEIWNHATEAAYGPAAAPALLLIVLSALPTLLLAAKDRGGAG
jgi:iron(III) transport system permease protein